MVETAALLVDHVLFIDGVFSPKNHGDLGFHRVNAPTSKELNALVATISERVARDLEHQGCLARGEHSDQLTLKFPVLNLHR